MCGSVSTSLITDLEHSTNLNTFRSVIDIDIMSSSSADELPDIPGTKYSWMEDDASSSSRSPRKLPKRSRISAVEKEKKTYKGSRKKKPTIMMDTSSDDDFINPKQGPSKPKTVAEPLTEEERKRLKKKEYNDRARAKQSPAQKRQERQKDAERHAAARANET